MPTSLFTDEPMSTVPMRRLCDSLHIVMVMKREHLCIHMRYLHVLDVKEMMEERN